MPAVKRWAFNLFCLVSLLIFAASVALWVRSVSFSDYFYSPEFQWNSGSGIAAYRTEQYGVGWRWCSVYVHRVAWQLRTQTHADTEWRYSTLYQRPRSSLSLLQRVAILLGHFQAESKLTAFPAGAKKEQTLMCPLWLFLPFGILPVVWWRKRRANRGRGFAVEQVAKAA